MATVSILRFADRLVAKTQRLMQSARTEEELRIGFEKILEPVLRAIGATADPRYERFGSDTRTIYHGRPDAVHGQVIIEYERPRAFRSAAAVAHANEQLCGYLAAQADEVDTGKAAGVGFDGASIFFVRPKPPGRQNKQPFLQEGPHRFNVKTASTLLTYLRALFRSPLTAEGLAERFGPQSALGQAAVSALADALAHWGSDRVRVFFEEWKRLFGIVYGAQFRAHHKREAEELASCYSVGSETGVQELLFCIHTYFAFLMKLIAAEIVSLKDSAFGSSFCEELTHASQRELTARLIDMEDGGVYAKRGIRNFLEGDFFRWYLDAFGSPRLQEALTQIARALHGFEPATTTIEPDTTRDLLKKLYQYLVPQSVRHRLGEYYTPDWLAELVLNEVRYDGNATKRLLDPACGSGTFLVLAIRRARQYAAKHRQPPAAAAKRILQNLWGFDLNPLAVIAARTNYLFAMGDLVDELPSVEIPVYLADSVLWPRPGGAMSLNFVGGDYLEVKTSLPEPFHVPAIWLEHKGLLIKRAAPLVEELVSNGYSPDEALRRLRKLGLVFPPHDNVVRNFYDELLVQQKEGKNGIWARFLKNSFAPMMAGQFDLVVGNPPWIRWGYLSDEYRESTVHMWKSYGLFSLRGHAARLGGGEKDFSMLFTHAAADYYLKKGGKLGFLITQEVFKSKGAGEGFRKFRLGDGEPLKVNKAHDLVTVKPFEGAANKTAAIVLTKGRKTTYPVPYTVWTRKKGVGRVPTDATLDEAMPLLRKEHLVAQPIDARTGSWQTVRRSQTVLQRIRGDNAYKARRGASTEPYGVFWLELVEVLSGGDLLVRNLTAKGKRKVRQLKDPERIESDLVFPAVRGADIRRWRASPGVFVLLSQDPRTSEPYPEPVMKDTWPRTYSYLSRFRDVLLSRGSRTVRELAERTAFYAMFGIGQYTVARYKTVWKRMAADLVAAVISQHKTPFGYKTVIPTDTTALFATDNEDVAHYLCAIINSGVVREFVKSYSSAGRGFGAPSVMNHVGIPKYDKRNKVHRELAGASKALHELGYTEAARQEQERKVDMLARRLFGLTN